VKICADNNSPDPPLPSTYVIAADRASIFLKDETTDPQVYIPSGREVIPTSFENKSLRISISLLFPSPISTVQFFLPYSLVKIGGSNTQREGKCIITTRAPLTSANFHKDKCQPCPPTITYLLAEGHCLHHPASHRFALTSDNSPGNQQHFSRSPETPLPFSTYTPQETHIQTRYEASPLTGAF
jgi:hypothetical protein